MPKYSNYYGIKNKDVMKLKYNVNYRINSVDDFFLNEHYLRKFTYFAKS